MAKLSVDQALLKAKSHAKKGEIEEAQKLYRAVLKAFPNNKRAQQSLTALDKSKQPAAMQGPPQDTINQLINLYNRGQLTAVIEQATKLTEQYPEAFFVWNLLGAANKGLGQVGEASEAFNKVTELNPAYADGFNNLGITLQDQGKLDEAIASYKQARSLNPDYAEAYNNMGTALQDQGKLDEAIEAYNKALSLKPDYAEAYNNVGNALQYQGKLRVAIEAYEKALSLKPDYSNAYNNMGTAIKSQGKLDEAIASYNKALSLQPDYAEAYNNMGNALRDLGKPDEAILSYKKALSLKPDYSEARAQKIFQQARICSWSAMNEDWPYVSQLGVIRNNVPPFTMLSIEDAPDRHLLRSKLFSTETFPNHAFAFPKKTVHKSNRLRIGYFSADFREHPVAYLIAKVLDLHDRDQFEIFGYSLHGSEKSEMRQRLSKSFSSFVDAQNMSHKDVALKARKDGIDIAIDLNGYTVNARPRIFVYRAAPIQINYLGYPGSMGAEFIDYIIADRNLIPDDFQKFYCEKPIYLPNHYQAQNDELEIANETPTRSSLELPEHGFVFCAINNSYKITAREFDIWMRLLQKVDGSVLWLLKSNKCAKENLVNEAVARGIAPERLVFAKKVSHEKYLAQFRQADLYLDTFNYNAGATASNALWAGLPLLTMQGKSYTARMASSLLHSIRLPELITKSELEYETLALRLAQNPELLAALKQKLAINRTTKPLFNTEVFTRHLEDGYQQVYQRYLDGKKPDTITVLE